MLTHIHLKNFTIIKSLSIDLADGLSVLTGETGAGKSILVDAVSIGLGARFDTRFMRHASASCEITLCFDLMHLNNAKVYLQEQHFDVGYECVIRRVLTKEGRSKCSLNETPCTVQFIRQLGQYLVCFYGQHAHQALLQPKSQRRCLDRFAEHIALCDRLQALYDRYVQLEKQRVVLEGKNKTAIVQRDYLTYQLDELSLLDLKQGTWEALSQQHQEYCRLNHNRTQLDQLQMLLTNHANNPIAALSQAVAIIDELDANEYSNLRQLLNTAEIHLQEATLELQHYELNHERDQEGFEQLDKKISHIYDLSRKHHVPPNELWKTVVNFQQEMDDLNTLNEQIIVVANEREAILKQYKLTASKLTMQRKKAAVQLSLRVTEQLQQLGMAGAVFQVQLMNRQEKIHAEGQEKIVFRVSTNPGQPLTELQKIISGGELSRLGLALQVIAQDNQIPRTLIFDEVDTGIGGQTAQVVGELLRQLAKNVQVLCITHLPQVASKANHHLNVIKSICKNETTASIGLLNREERIKELARMSTGGKMTDVLLKHAEALLTETEV